MPTIIDATVVNQPYDTSGNGGRKLVRLSNGWVIAVVTDKSTSTYPAWNVRIYKSSDNGQTWSQLCYIYDNVTSPDKDVVDPSVVCNGTTVTVIASHPYSKSVFSFTFDATTQANTNLWGIRKIVDSGQSALGLNSLAINSAGTELHAAWASKNSAYPNSFNIRYAKGTINGDGSVTWGAVEQRTTVNMSGWDYKNPTIVVRNDGYPIIFAEALLNGIYYIKRIIFNGSSWNEGDVYNRGSYTQSSPSACVDKNGRIWVAWHGTDSADTNAWNIRVAYSDDGGVTWSSMTKLTSGNSYSQGYPSITVNKNNEVFILWSGSDVSDVYDDIRMIKYSSGSWGSVSVVSAGTTGHKFYPSTLPDVTIDFSTPLFIYKDTQNNKVGFYGTWVNTTISVTPGYIGQKTSSDKSNILTYSITTDGTMSDITEKINGVTIATRTNPINEQEFTVSLSQEQWDAIKYGNAHTLTIEMNGDTWTYTFDKRLNANDDILSAVKGVQDLQDHLNAVKAQLASVIRAKGGTVNDTDAWSAFVSAIANLSAKKFASGTVTSSSSSSLFQYAGSTSAYNTYFITVTGLTFKPSLIFAINNASYQYSVSIYSEVNDGFYSKTVKLFTYSGLTSSSTTYNLKGDVSPANVNSTGFTLPAWTQNATYTWFAFE